VDEMQSPSATEDTTARPPFARGAVPATAALLAAVLLVAAGGYGYHRDELYFLAAARHPAWRRAASRSRRSC
jgi:hypothetical protein